MVNISMAAARMDIASQAIYFDINCRHYARLSTFLDNVKTKNLNPLLIFAGQCRLIKSVWLEM